MLFAWRVRLLEDRLARVPSLLVALSGGVDSAVLLGAAARAVPGRVVAATTCSPAVPDEEVEEARTIAAQLGVPHRALVTHELEDAGYRANAGERCYFCRREMYDALHDLAREEGLAFVADGLNADDLEDDRPGVRAARERRILHPLREAGFGKADVRRLALGLGLGVHDKPAQPCLASRLPVGVEVTVERLERVHRAEQALRALGYREIRVRCEGRHGRIEIARRDLARAVAQAAVLEAAVVAQGFQSAAVDPAGYRWGGAGFSAGTSAGSRPARTAPAR